MARPLVFPLHFLVTMLGNLGWPRPEGLLRKKVVDASLVDFSVEFMLEHALALGLARRERAIQLFAGSFDRDWETETPAKLYVDVFFDALGPLSRCEIPWETCWRPFKLSPTELAIPRGPSLLWKELSDERFRVWVLRAHAMMLMLGLLYREDANAAFQRKFAHDDALKPDMERLNQAGLKADPGSIPTSIEEIADMWDSSMREYEDRFGTFPAAPPPVSEFFRDFR